MSSFPEWKHVVLVLPTFLLTPPPSLHPPPHPPPARSPRRTAVGPIKLDTSNEPHLLIVE
jgi:hypothetical protein